MVAAGLDDLVRKLPRDGSGALAIDRGPWSASRVGRNAVWRVAHRAGSGEAYFAKFYPSACAYRRELGGLQLAGRLATGRDWLMAAEVLAADDRERYILTAGLPGSPLRTILRTALRRGQAPSVRRAALEKTRHCLNLVADWIALWQDQSPGAVDDLQDDRPDAVAGRITEKQERLRSGSVLAGLGIGETPRRIAVPDGDAPLVLTHGDLSFGNIFVDEGKIGIVDFENMGIGPRFRDSIWIEYGLEQCNFRWYYRSSGALLDLLDVPRPDDRLAGLYRLEFVIDHVLILKARLGARPWGEWALGIAERRWARRELARLERLLATG